MKTTSATTNGRPLLALLLLLLPCMATMAQQNKTEQLFSRFKAVAGFDHRFPREKVYLHLDNNAYFTDETIYFKAYVVRASSLCPSTLSRVLYVELLNDKGQTTEQRTLRLDSVGQAAGDIQMQLPVKEGFYEIRAYTREMVNWGTEACFSRVIPIFRKPSKKEAKKRLEAEEYELPEITMPEEGRKASMGCPRPSVYGRESERRLSFFPEGGNRVKGVAQRIAYLLTDGRGRPAGDTLQLFAADGRQLAVTIPEHEGMGSFTVPAGLTDGYVEISGKKNRFPLPAVSDGEEFALKADVLNDGVNLTVARTGNGTEAILTGLAVLCREKVCYFDTLSLAGGQAVELFLPGQALHGGVNRIELFDTGGHSLSRRLVWKKAPERRLGLRIRQNAESYEAFAPIVLDMDLKDADGQPVSSSFSLAVREEKSEMTGSETGGIGTEMLLSSEVKGYIARPEYYFEADDAEHRRALDLLLMVQGWTANTFATMCGRDSFRLRQPLEDKLTLSGTLYHDNDKFRPYPGITIDLKMYSRQGGSLEASAVSDENGRFAFVSNVDYSGDWIASFLTKNGKGEKVFSRIAIDRWFSPEIQPYHSAQLELRTPRPPGTAGIQPETFEWTDTISRIVSTKLPTAKITAKRKYRGFTGNRYTQNGGEKGGMRQSDTFYNFELEVERYKDAGYRVGNVMDFIELLDNQAEVSRNHSTPSSDSDVGTKVGVDYGDEPGKEAAEAKLNETGPELSDALLYRGRDALVSVNNGAGSRYDGNELLAEEIKSVAIVKGPGRIGRLLGIKTDAEYGIFIYEHPDAYLYRSKKGVEKRRVKGYHIPKKFYSPQYNGTDLPSEKDVRRTLYWNPDVRTDAGGHASVLFYGNSYDGQKLRISARGISASGQTIDFER